MKTRTYFGMNEIYDMNVCFFPVQVQFYWETVIYDNKESMALMIIKKTLS